MAIVSASTGRWELVGPAARSPIAQARSTPPGAGISSTRSLTAIPSPTATTTPCNWSTTWSTAL